MDTGVLSYRGFMLDAGRHFMPVEDVLKLIEGAAVCGMNRMHWHLTEDQGWRVEIKRWPELARVGSRRGPSYFGRVSETENNCGYYTQDEIRRVVAFARERGVEIVPEVEIPGHASAMLAAYPRFGCRRLLSDGTVREAPYDYRVLTYGGVFPGLICAGREDAVRFLKDILDEVCELFPGPEFHIGGDEAVKMHWRRCPDCQKRMKDKGLRNERELQRDLVEEIGAYLASKGKKTIVWNESLDGGPLPEHFIVQHWMGSDAETAEFLSLGGRVIRSDNEYFYVNRPYSALDCYRIWQTPPAPAWAKGNEKGVLGVECALWSERVTNAERAAYLLFPRMAAVALRASRPNDFPTWESFRDELREIMRRVAALGLPVAPESDWRMSGEAIEAEKKKDAETSRDPRMQKVFDVCDAMLMQEGLEKLLREIDMPWDFAIRVMDCAWSRQKEFCGTAPVRPERGAGELAEHLARAVENRWKGPWKDLPMDVFVDTMRCFSRFVREHYRTYGCYGFDRGFWTTRQADARLFRLGELEYELMDDAGRRVISLHIPSDAKLEAGLLNASVQKARDFLQAYFPDWADAPMECCTWLLNPGLKPLLPEGSRILRFQNAFDTDAPEAGGSDVLEWVYGLPREQFSSPDLAALPETTTLQRRMKRCLLRGEQFGPARGVLAREFA